MGLWSTVKRAARVGVSTIKAPITAQLKATTYLASKAGIRPAARLDSRLRGELKRDVRDSKASLAVIPAAGVGFLSGGPAGAVIAGVAGHVRIAANEEAAEAAARAANATDRSDATDRAEPTERTAAGGGASGSDAPAGEGAPGYVGASMLSGRAGILAAVLLGLVLVFAFTPRKK